MFTYYFHHWQVGFYGKKNLPSYCIISQTKITGDWKHEK